MDEQNSKTEKQILAHLFEKGREVSFTEIIKLIQKPRAEALRVCEYLEEEKLVVACQMQWIDSRGLLRTDARGYLITKKGARKSRRLQDRDPFKRTVPKPA